MILALLLLSFVAGIFVGICRVDPAQKPNRMPACLPRCISSAITLLRKPFIVRRPTKGRNDSYIVDPGQYGDHFFLTKDQVEDQLEPSSWQRLAYDDFKTKLLAKDTNLKTFPCIYATSGYRAGEHRYLFLHSDNPSEPQNIHLITPALQAYLLMAPSLGPNTSLVIFAAPPSRPVTIQEHTANFWSTLRGLRIADPMPWPLGIPSQTLSSTWTFCFANEPIFPILLTPSHDKRFSRQMSVPLIAIQPKWALDALLGHTPQHRDAATGKVRQLLAAYDAVPMSPDLTRYGDPGSSESRQLCLPDDNEHPVECPYEDFDR